LGGFVFLSLAALAADPSAAPQRSTAESAAITRAEGAAMRLAGTLKARVVEEMGKGGPVAAVSVCNAEAPAVAATIESETGVKLGRSSLRLRNPANAAPPWVQEWLVAQGERPAAGASPAVSVAEGNARVIKPIPVEAACLVCHGAPTTIAPEVKAELTRRYPLDLATGYAVGDLRGALWAEVPIER
jgi:hypothetical protein